MERVVSNSSLVCCSPDIESRNTNNDWGKPLGAREENTKIFLQRRQPNFPERKVSFKAGGLPSPGLPKFKEAEIGAIDSGERRIGLASFLRLVVY